MEEGEKQSLKECDFFLSALKTQRICSLELSQFYPFYLLRLHWFMWKKKSALKVHGLEFSKIQNKDLAGSVSRNWVIFREEMFPRGLS